MGFTSMKVRKGDLLALAEAGHFDVLIHGCNCQHTMGAGIAKQIKQRFPSAYEADLATPKGSAKLGSISSVAVDAGPNRLFIVNGYTQTHWRGSGVKVDYEALRSVMKHDKRQFSGLRIGYPRIGAGLAGGDWALIQRIIEEELDTEDHTLVEYQA